MEHMSLTLPMVDQGLLAALEDAVEWEQEEMVVGLLHRVSMSAATSTWSPPRKWVRTSYQVLL